MSKTFNVWICGPMGKMGTALREAIDAEADVVITGLVSPDHKGQKCETNSGELEIYASLEELSSNANKPDVVVDFTHASAAFQNALYCAKNGIDFVSGTTGLKDEDRAQIVAEFEKTDTSAIIASNFSIGAVLMMRFAGQAAKYFTHGEIVEIHHTQKLDAPSGTAITTQNKMAEHSQKDVDLIPIHSIRLPGSIAHQQVYLSNVGEVLRIEHDANDRKCFMPGIIMAIRKVHELSRVTFTIEDLLFES